MALSVKQKIALLKSYDFEVVARDPLVNKGLPGAWMIKDGLSNGSEPWALVGDDTEQILDEAIEFHGLTAYMVGTWEHIFHEKSPASSCRIVLDKVAQAVSHAQVQVGNSWKNASEADRADLLESMNDDDVWSCSDLQEGLDQTNELPEWV